MIATAAIRITSGFRYVRPSDDRPAAALRSRMRRSRNALLAYAGTVFRKCSARWRR
jgi:hypothetical protein